MNLKNRIANEKVTAAFIAASVSAFLIGTVGMVWPELAERIPAGYESALTGILTIGVAWWKREHNDGD